jgi:hypothetical protein
MRRKPPLEGSKRYESEPMRDLRPAFVFLSEEPLNSVIK